MMEGRARHHQAVDQRRSQANLDPLRRGAEHAVARRAVDIDPIVDTRMESGQHARRSVDDDAYMAYQRAVEDCVDDLAIVAAAFAHPIDDGARCRLDRFHLPNPYVTVQTSERDSTFVSECREIKQPD